MYEVFRRRVEGQRWEERTKKFKQKKEEGRNLNIINSILAVIYVNKLRNLNINSEVKL